METMLANYTVSVTELKRNFASILSETKGRPVAVLNHNKPEAYLLSAKHYEELLQALEYAQNALEDAEDIKLIEELKNGPFVEINLHDL